MIIKNINKYNKKINKLIKNNDNANISIFWYLNL